MIVKLAGGATNDTGMNPGAREEAGEGPGVGNVTGRTSKEQGGVSIINQAILSRLGGGAVTVLRLSRTASTQARLVSSGLDKGDMFVSRSNKTAAAPANRLVFAGLGTEDAAVSR